MADESTNVAIACQGGGSHTAFTAGVLKAVLSDWDDDLELVGISGTSGGAFNALAVWYGLVTEDETKAVTLLDSLWDDLAAREPGDRLLNDWLRTVNRLQSSGMPVPQLSPYQVPGSSLGKDRIRTVLERHIDFEAIPHHCTYRNPELVVGSVDIEVGVFDTFTNEDVTVDAVLASAAIPNLFEAVEVDETLHWDGLFSQNPPVRDLMHQPPPRKPDELWIIQINPQVRKGEPKRLDEIADRRNSLAGNISLNQELGFIEQVNEWVEEGKLSESTFAKTTINRIQMDGGYHYSSKLDRRPAFLQELMAMGEERGTSFLNNRAAQRER